MHDHPGAGAQTRARRRTQVHEVTNLLGAQAPHGERAEMTERAVAAGPGESRPLTQRRIESTQNRNAGSPTDEVRRHEHLRQHPYQLAVTARLLKRPRRHHLPGRSERLQPSAKLDEFPKHRVHARNRAASPQPSATARAGPLWTATGLCTTPGRNPRVLVQMIGGSSAGPASACRVAELPAIIGTPEVQLRRGRRGGGRRPRRRRAGPRPPPPESPGEAPPGRQRARPAHGCTARR